MARIIGGIGASHTPTIGFAKDRHTKADAQWTGTFDIFEPVTAWLEEKKPDVLFVIYNDHITSFFFDHYSPFVLGVDSKYETADEGGGPREYPPVAGHAELARHIGHSMFADEPFPCSRLPCIVDNPLRVPRSTVQWTARIQ